MTDQEERISSSILTFVIQNNFFVTLGYKISLGTT